MCKVGQELLNEYIDGTIEPVAGLVLEEHLKLCPQCRRELNRLKIVDWELSRFFNEQIEIPPELTLLKSAVWQACASFDAGGEGGEGKEQKSRRSILANAVNFQLNVLRNSVKFLSLVPGLNRAIEPGPGAAPPKKKKSVLRRLVGL